MKRSTLAAAAVAVAASAAAPGAAVAAPVNPAAPPTPTSQAKLLLGETKGLARATPQRSQLLAIAARASGQQQRGQACAAIESAQALRATLGRLPAAGQRRALAVDAAALGLQQQLLASARSKRCGGGAGPASVAQPVPTLQRSDTKGLELTVALPEVGVGTLHRRGKLWTQLGARQAEVPGKPGEPAIPVASFSIALPEGATVQTRAIPGASYALRGVNVLPVQNEPIDKDVPAPNFFKGAFKDPKFVGPSKSAYAKTFPAKAADVLPAGTARGLKIATIQVPLASYDGKRKRLTVRRSVRVVVDFRGGDQYGGEIGPWDKFGSSIAGTVLNQASVVGRLKGKIRIPDRCGEEFLIITHSDMRASADKLAVARNAAGIKTRVFETVAGQAGTTREQIRDFIRGRATHPVCVRPGYVLLLGNEEWVPTFELEYGTSDLPYATTDDADTLPDLAQARVPGNVSEVDIAIDKIVAYGNSPLPGSAASHALVAAQFQDDDGDGRENRTFIQFAETISEGLEARGNTVHRVYGEEPHGDPQQFNDGTELPASLKKPGFGWNGTGADITSAWNAGTFLAIHRDHGWTDGWGTPYFTTNDVENLANVALPVLMSINCSSGAYDRDDSSFVTRALGRAGGGAVAAFGDTEDSPSTHNSVQGLGFVDALLPSVLPDEGPATKQRLGDALVHGKLRLNTLIPAAGSGNTRKQHQIWQLFGDPTMRMKGGGSKFVFDPSIFDIVLERFPVPVGPPEPRPGYRVNLANLAGLDGQTVALRKGTEVVGQGLVEGGRASIEAIFGDGSVKPGELTVVIEAPTDAPPVVLPVPVEKTVSSVAQTCPSSVVWGKELKVTGQLTGAPAGSQVKVVFTYAKDLQGVAPVPAKTVEVLADVAADGSYSATYQTIRQDQGQWSVHTEYAGDSSHAAAASAPCDVTVLSGSPTIG